MTRLKRLAFRFCAVYFGLYVVTTQMLGGLIPRPIPQFRPLEKLPPLLSLFRWTAHHVLHLSHEPVVLTGSGDSYLDWIHLGWLLPVSLVVSVAWWALDRKGRHDAREYAWFRVFMRFAVGTTMVSYGLAKVVPLQMQYPSFARLVEPYGHFSPMGVLWTSIGAAPAYEIFVGLAETVGGILLFIPRTALLGSLICLADVIEVFSLNMTYDIPVKLFSFHLVLMSLFLLAPYVPQLVGGIVLRRPVTAMPEPPLVASEGRRRALMWAQVVLGVWLTAGTALGSREGWFQYGGGAPRPALYGLWNVDELEVDGAVVPPLLTDSTRWRRVIAQRVGLMTFQGMDDGFANFRAKFDTLTDSLTLTGVGSVEGRKGAFAVVRAPPDSMTLDGVMDDRRVRLRLTRIDPSTFLLVSRGFHWIQELPFNR